jgi:hypothetical protein
MIKYISIPGYVRIGKDNKNSIESVFLRHQNCNSLLRFTVKVSPAFLNQRIIPLFQRLSNNLTALGLLMAYIQSCNWNVLKNSYYSN